MKTCPKCNAVNKDSQRLCVNCDSYLGNVASEYDDDYAEKVIMRSNRKSKTRSIITTVLFLLFYCSFLVFTMILSYDIFGGLERYFRYSLLYIPCLILFLFPYNKVYCWYRKKKKKDESYLADSFIAIFKAVAWIYLICLYVGTFQMMNVEL
ncbi:hypothetical protein RBG61_06900 [Paludicola sp. MB14-C6]|uniref:hypothetical protein n=1 Tax=Paludihabitans sp. MB14-C6 TaxID=3070656 RepID=UPI0027DDE018|nr:hypothetical protein [Paludicola sp. MB14-C6]WMJ24390.1 hypothetical protein RBG61_06900 [Paludicola sp. MB14-C6]